MNCIAMVATFLCILALSTTASAATRFPYGDESGENRLLCTHCTWPATGCSSTQYCAFTFYDVIKTGCCREKQAAGEFCIPKWEGLDCTSGTCNNNIIPAFSIFNVPIAVQHLNQWVGKCA